MRYAYKCSRCATDLECDFPIGKAKTYIKCRECGARMARQINGNPHVIWKGGGWTSVTE